MGNEIKNLLMEIEKERVRRGMTIEQWSDFLDMPTSTYCGWMYERRTPRLNHFIFVLRRAGLKLQVVKEGSGNG